MDADPVDPVKHAVEQLIQLAAEDRIGLGEGSDILVQAEDTS